MFINQNQKHDFDSIKSNHQIFDFKNYMKDEEIKIIYKQVLAKFKNYLNEKYAINKGITDDEVNKHRRKLLD